MILQKCRLADERNVAEAYVAQRRGPSQGLALAGSPSSCPEHVGIIQVSHSYCRKSLFTRLCYTHEGDREGGGSYK